MSTDQNLQNLFDAQPKSILIRFEKSNPYINELPEPFGIESQLDFPKPGLTFLLGKNGSGKTKLLKGLSALSGDAKNNFPSINLIFDWPSKDLLFQWAELAQESFIPPKPLIISKPEPREVNTEKDKQIGSEPHSADLPLLSAVLSNIKSTLNPEFPAPFEDLTSQEVLEFFNFGQQSINKWKLSQKAKKIA